MSMTRRKAIAGGLMLSSLPLWIASAGAQRRTPGEQDMTADLILVNGRFSTLDPTNPAADAVAIANGRFIAVGSERDVRAHAGNATRVVDMKRRRVIPGLIDSHMHIIRGGLNYNMELRWDGVRSLATALGMLKQQVDRTPSPQWVRVVGGFTEHQFVEKRLPTLDELNAIAPDTPVFILHLYDRALLNAAALRAVGFTKDTPNPPGGEIVRDRNGNPTGVLLARPNASILYSTLTKGPKLPPEYQKNSTRHFMREVNRLGVTGVIDAGGGFQNYPDDYRIIEELHAAGELTVRIAYNLFTQRPKEELADFTAWAGKVRPGQGDDLYRHNGAGEMLVYSAADFEDFREPRPGMPPSMEGDLEPVVRLLAANRWPWRLHATYDETISRALDVFEKVNRDVPLAGLHWLFDHCETISDRSIERIAALGGGIAVQHRMAFQGEYFVERYGAAAAARTPPIRRMLAAGVPVGAGTDATRVASYNPWVSLSWLVTGRTVGGLELYGEDNRLDREAALRLWTQANAWFSSESGKKGQIRVGQLADLAVLSADYFAVDEAEIQDITSDLTLLGGKVVHASGDFGSLAPPLPPAMPDWSPVRSFGGYQTGARGIALPAAYARSSGAGEATRFADGAFLQGAGCCAHAAPRRAAPPRIVSAPGSMWGPMGCSCWAF
jgi:predicted amidohydrolase YtcJ